MACLKVPLLPIPQLPDPLSIPLPPLPLPVSISATLCCTVQIQSPSVQEIADFLGLPLPPLPPLVINTTVINLLLQNIGKVNAFLDKLQISCPLS